MRCIQDVPEELVYERAQKSAELFYGELSALATLSEKICDLSDRIDLSDRRRQELLAYALLQADAFDSFADRVRLLRRRLEKALH